MGGSSIPSLDERPNSFFCLCLASAYLSVAVLTAAALRPAERVEMNSRRLVVSETVALNLVSEIQTGCATDRTSTEVLTALPLAFRFSPSSAIQAV